MRENDMVVDDDVVEAEIVSRLRPVAYCDSIGADERPQSTRVRVGVRVRGNLDRFR